MSWTINHNIEAPLQNGSILTTGLIVTHTINAVTEGGGGSVDTVNGVLPDINKNVQLSYDDLDDLPTIPDQLSDLSEDSTHRTVTDTEKNNWNFSVPQYIAFQTEIPFDNICKTLANKIIDADTILTPQNIALDGSCKAKIIGDGTHTLTLNGFTNVGSLNFDNGLGIANYFAFFKNTTEILYTIYRQESIDITPPSLQTATVEAATPDTITLDYDENINPLNVPDLADYIIVGSITGIVNPASINILDDKITLVCASNFNGNETITLDYTQNVDTSKRIRDLSGNYAASLNDQSINNNINQLSIPVAADFSANYSTVITVNPSTGNVTVSGTEADFRNVYYNKSFQEVQHTIPTGNSAQIISLGINVSKWCGIRLSSGGNNGLIYFVSETAIIKAFASGKDLGGKYLAVGDSLKITYSAGVYSFSLKKYGESLFTAWFTIQRSDIVDAALATYWAIGQDYTGIGVYGSNNVFNAYLKL